ncbi:MAG: PfkB family carbohydrate kinase [Acidithiobacillus sp.]|nr:PfkB family carbohydrate kinase [Acidithiobacillus sp.]
MNEIPSVGWIVGECLIDDFGDFRRVGGAPFNVACHLWSLGDRPGFISRVGQDPAAAEIRQYLQRCPDMHAVLQEDATLPTGRVLVHDLGGGEHRFEILPQQAYDAIAWDGELQESIKNQPFWLYHGSLAFREDGPGRSTWRHLAAQAAWRFVDINLRAGNWEPNFLAELIQGASVLKCNQEELDILRREFFLAGDSLQGAVAALAKHFSIAEVLVTRGAEGAIHWDGANLWQSRAPQVPIQDTVGAGDAFSAAWIHAKIRGRPVAQALRAASDLAARVCTLTGALPRNPDEFYQDLM